MPAYNSEKYIRKSIESVINQSYKKIELIICDDCSNDNTVDIVNEFIKKDRRIILLKNNFKKGTAGARNTCLEYATGEFISFLDSDDVWGTEKLEKQVYIMISRNLDFTYSNYYILNNGKHIKARPLNTFDSLTYTCDIGCLTVMLRRTSIDKKFPYTPKEDYAYWLSILKTGITAYNVGDLNAYYRKSPTSISSNKLKEIKKQFIVLKEIANMPKFKIFARLITYSLFAAKKHFF